MKRAEDHLEEVTSLVDIVRYQTKCFVSVEYFRRPWCVAELATAFVYEVPIVPLLVDGFRFSEDGPQMCLQAVELWQADSILQNLQASSETVLAAYRHLCPDGAQEDPFPLHVLDRKDAWPGSDATSGSTRNHKEQVSTSNTF
eukprot:Skav213987  [mRNA]  locus=scaffold2843:38564:40125:+ [translate_table: standard]